MMFPVENPLERYRRNEATYRGFRELKNKSLAADPLHLEIFCIQEGNPVHKVARRLASHLNMFQSVAEANVGVRVGGVSYPLFLQEGLISLWNGSLKNTASSRVVLSNPVPEMTVKVSGFEVPVSLQLAERRVALLVTGEWDGLRIGVANLHVHHGPPEGLFNKRRKEEFELLTEVMQPELQNCDLFFLVGDFNCEQHHTEYQMMEKLGFVELSRGAQGESLVTWDPEHNPICQRSARLNDPADPATYWDSEPHQFDHIMVRTKKNPGSLPPAWKVTAKRIFDSDSHGAWLSDHYGLCVDLEC